MRAIISNNQINGTYINNLRHCTIYKVINKSVGVSEEYGLALNINKTKYPRQCTITTSVPNCSVKTDEIIINFKSIRSVIMKEHVVIVSFQNSLRTVSK